MGYGLLAADVKNSLVSAWDFLKKMENSNF